MPECLASIDTYHSTELNLVNEGRSDEFWRRFHALLGATIRSHGGSIYSLTGDGATVVFPSIQLGVRAATDLLRQLGDFNRDQSSDFPDSPVFVRIGLTLISDAGALDPARAPADSGQRDLFDVVGLQREAPVGRIAISQDAYRAIGFEQDMFRTGTTRGLRAQGAFVSKRRQASHYSELTEGLDEVRADAVPPIHISSWSRLCDPHLNLLNLRATLTEPLLVVLGNTYRFTDSNHGSAATSDATPVIELLSSLPPNPDVASSVDIWKDASDLAGSRNSVVIGSGTCNGYAFAVNDLIVPVHFSKDRGVVHPEIVATCRGDEWHYGERHRYGMYCALVVHCRSPFNSRGKMIWVAGITGRGTQVGMRYVMDLVRDPTLTMRKHSIPLGFQPVASVVGVSIDSPHQEPPIDRRLFRYKVLWSVNAAGQHFESTHTGPSPHAGYQEG